MKKEVEVREGRGRTVKREGEWYEVKGKEEMVKRLEWEELISVGRIGSDESSVQRHPLLLVLQDMREEDSGFVKKEDFTLLFAFNFVRSELGETKTLAGKLLYYDSISLERFIVGESCCLEMSELYEVDKEEGECVVCFAEDKNTVLLPCRHVCVGIDCLRKMEKCPLCRASILSYLTVKPL